MMGGGMGMPGMMGGAGGGTGVPGMMGGGMMGGMAGGAGGAAGSGQQQPQKPSKAEFTYKVKTVVSLPDPEEIKEIANPPRNRNM